MTPTEHQNIVMSCEKYNILYNLLDALGCDPIVSRLRPETVDMILRDLGSNRVRFGSLDDPDQDKALNDYQARIEREYKTETLGTQTVLFSDDDYVIC